MPYLIEKEKFYFKKRFEDNRSVGGAAVSERRCRSRNAETNG